MKNQMKNKNPFITAILILVLLFALLIYIALAHTINTSRGPVEPPDWIPLARIILYIFAACCFPLAFLMKRTIREKSAEKIIKKGQDPDASILIVGSALFLAPSCLAFFIFILGGLLTDIYICSVLSFIGIIFWSWYQRAAFKIDRKSKSRIISSATRSYTIILILLGFISLCFLAIYIFLIVELLEYFTAPVSLTLISIPIYAFFTLGCWGTAIFRFRRSPYALFATKAISIAILCWFPFGTAAFIYWMGWIRKKEKPENTLGQRSNLHP